MMDAQDVRRASRLLVPGIPVVVFVLDFSMLFASYVLLSWVTPSLLGEVADRRAWFAAWIALVKAPITFVWVMAGSWRGWATAMRNGEVRRPEVLTGRRKILARVTHAAGTAHAREHNQRRDDKRRDLHRVVASGRWLL